LPFVRVHQATDLTIDLLVDRHETRAATGGPPCRVCEERVIGFDAVPEVRLGVVSLREHDHRERGPDGCEDPRGQIPSPARSLDPLVCHDAERGPVVR
jgi:hypothetical protein